MSGVAAGSSAVYQQQLTYNKFLADTAHKYHMAAGLKVCFNFLPVDVLRENFGDSTSERACHEI